MLKKNWHTCFNTSNQVQKEEIRTVKSFTVHFTIESWCHCSLKCIRTKQTLQNVILNCEIFLTLLCKTASTRTGVEGISLPLTFALSPSDLRGEEGQPQQFLVRATFKSSSFQYYFFKCLFLPDKTIL